MTPKRTFKSITSIYCAACLTRASTTKDKQYYYDWYLKQKLFRDFAEYQYAIETSITDELFCDNPLWSNNAIDLPWNFFNQFDAHYQWIMLSHLLEIDWETYTEFTNYLTDNWVDYLSL